MTNAMAVPITAMFDEMLEPITRAFSPEVARALVSVRIGPKAEARIAELANKSEEGLLTDLERSEYELYVHTLDLISVLQAKARLWLSRESPNDGSSLPK